MDNNFRNRIYNEANMLEGCKNRMCVTDEVEELISLHAGAVHHAASLFELNLERLKIKKLRTAEAENEV